MYDCILVPTDGSPAMDGVLGHALELASVHDAVVHGLYVVDTGNFATLPMETSWDGVAGVLREEGEQAIEEFERLAGDQGVETTIQKGNPSGEIVEYVRRENCDTIVMGTHGRAGIDRLLLGSVAERVVRASPVPVVTVPVHEAEQTSVQPADVPN